MGLNQKRLKAETVWRVREEYARGVPHSSIAARYGIALSTVGAIARRVTYSRLQDPKPSKLRELFQNFASAAQFDHARRLLAALNEVEFQTRQLDLPESWRPISEEIKQQTKELTSAVQKLFKRFDKEVPDEKKSFAETGKPSDAGKTPEQIVEDITGMKFASTPTPATTTGIQPAVSEENAGG